MPRNPRREQAVRVRLRHAEDGLRAVPTGEQGSHILTSMIGADGLALIAPGEGEARRGRAGGGRAPLRARDPRRLLDRRRRARARVKIVHVPRSGYAADGAIGSKQAAEVTLPRAELDRIWSAEYLERLARTYWRFLTRFSLGILRVLYSEDSREVVRVPAALRPAALPQAGVPPGVRRRHRHLADRQGAAGGAVRPADGATCGCRSSANEPEDERADEVTATISSEVVNFYPLIAGWGWFAKIGRLIYNQTQLRIHVIVTHAFLRSLANLDLEQSQWGALSPSFSPVISRSFARS